MSQNNNDVVYIQLDRPRELRYGHKALKQLVALTGMKLEDIETKGFDDFEVVEKMVYCGLLHDAKENNEQLQLEDMEDLLDHAPNYKHIIESVQKAFFAAWGVKPEDLGNVLQPAQAPEPEQNDHTTLTNPAE